MMRAKLRVPSGGSLHESGGEISSPSQVYSLGIASPGAKALLVSSSVVNSVSPSVFSGAAVVAEGGGDVMGPQPLTREMPIDRATSKNKWR
jgi:hypothetical protein